MLLGIKDINTHKCGLIHRNINLPLSLSQFPLCLLVCKAGRMGECTFWCRIKGAGHKMKYLHAQSMHKACTKYAQGCMYTGYTDCIQCANYASMHMPATCTVVHNLQSVGVRKFMCLHNMPKLQNVQSMQIPCCVQNACVLRTEVQKPICLSDVHIVQTAQRRNQVCKMHKVCKCRTDLHAQVGHRAR